MDAGRNKWQARAAAVVDAWTNAAARDPEGNQALLNIMHDSTVSPLYPSKVDAWQRIEDCDADPITSKSPKDKQAWAATVKADHLI